MADTAALATRAGDSGFCRDELMAWCEGQAGVDYVFGLAWNLGCSLRSRSKRRVVGKAEWLPGQVRGDSHDSERGMLLKES